MLEPAIEGLVGWLGGWSAMQRSEPQLALLVVRRARLLLYGRVIGAMLLRFVAQALQVGGRCVAHAGRAGPVPL